VRFAVPTGNFGNVFAGYVARRMGLPVGDLVVATNENDILSVFFNSGAYARGPVRFTITPAMDIQVASNFERYLFYRLGEDPAALRAFMRQFAETGAASVEGGAGGDFVATAVNVAETSATISAVYAESGYVVDPHTAVGLAAARRLPYAGPTVCLATAHPAKFPEAVDAAVGAPVARHERLERLRGLPARSTPVPASLQAIRDFIETHAARR
jgi:threonine synthase